MTTQASLLGILTAATGLALAPMSNAQQADPPKPPGERAEPPRGEKASQKPKEACPMCEAAKAGKVRPEHQHPDAGKPPEKREARRPGPEARQDLRAHPEETRGKAEAEFGKIKERIGDLRRDGKFAEADRLRDEMEERMKHRAAEMRERTAPMKRPEMAAPMKRHSGEAGRERQPLEGGELPQKLRHLMAAAENLHAAGMHDIAERVEEQAKAMRREMEERAAQQKPKEGEVKRPMAGGPPMPPMPPMPQLQQELTELREAVRNLNRRLDEIAKERR